MWIRKKVKPKKLKLEICGWNLNYSRSDINILSYDDFVNLKPQLLLSNSKYNIEDKPQRWF